MDARSRAQYLYLQCKVLKGQRSNTSKLGSKTCVQPDGWQRQARLTAAERICLISPAASSPDQGSLGTPAAEQHPQQVQHCKSRRRGPPGYRTAAAGVAIIRSSSCATIRTSTEATSAAVVVFFLLPSAIDLFLVNIRSRRACSC